MTCEDLNVSCKKVGTNKICLSGNSLKINGCTEAQIDQIIDKFNSCY